MLKDKFIKLSVRVASKLKRLRLLAKTIFSIDFLDQELEYFDLGTIALNHAVLKHLKNHPEISSILEIGTGPYATLASCLHNQNKDLKVTATEFNKELFDMAAKQLKARGHGNIKLIQTDLFDDLPENYDLIIFNPPYVPSTFGKKHFAKPSRVKQVMWDGGDDGLVLFRRFIDSIQGYNGEALIVLPSFFGVAETAQSLLKSKGLEYKTEPAFFSKYCIIKIN